jgi:hypothetical protein
MYTLTFRDIKQQKKIRLLNITQNRDSAIFLEV